MTEHHFETHRPVELYVELGKGNVHVLCTETTESTVRVAGKDAEEVVVEQSGDRISVVAPRRSGFFGGDSSLRIDVTVPTGSNPTVRTGSADIQIEGQAGTAQVRTGSGEVRVDTLEGPALVETGSGDVHVDDAHDGLRVKSGSGSVEVGHAAGPVSVSTGSGDVELGTTVEAAALKTGSGDMRVREAHSDVTAATGSGDLVVGRFHSGQLTAKGASGDVRVGIPAGIPVWTDVTTVSGAIQSTLHGAGQPEDGQDHIELRAKTVSGDIVLTEV